MFKISSTPLDVQSLKHDLMAAEAGALSVFEGLVRNRNDGKDVISLQYEAYEDLCGREAGKIFSEAKAKFDILKAHCVHRTGMLTINDVAVWVGVTAAHRDAAFKACRYIIDEIKHRLPIWKKEYYLTGDSGWVNCEECGHAHHRPAVSEQAFYSRQTTLKEIGPEGQARLKKAKVLVVGAGGLGCPALTSLAQAGVGTIGICDADKLEASNLHRQSLYRAQDIGRPKADLAAQALRDLNPFITVNVYPQRITPANAREIMKSYDMVLDCTDNFAAKFLLNDAAHLFKKGLVQAGIYQLEGQLRAFWPNSRGCLRCLWPKMPSDGCVDNCIQAGVIGVIPNVLGHLQAWEAVKRILSLDGQLNGDTLMVDFTTGQTRIKNPVAHDCPLCGVFPIITELHERHYRSSEDVAYEVNLFSFPGRLDDVQWVDIREEHERIVAPVVVPAAHFPLSSADKAAFPFPRTPMCLIFCGKGKRSLKFVKQLHENGMTQVRSVSGGAEAINRFFNVGKEQLTGDPRT